MVKTKLLYILPEYDEATATHLYHIFQLLEELGKKLEIFLIVEKSTGRPQINNLQKIATPKNIIERFLLIIWVRMRGYKTAYVHYSYWGAIFASLFMKTYYWHCEVYDQFSMPFEFSKKYLEKKLIDEWPMRVAMNFVDYLVTGTKTVGDYYRKEFNLARSKVKIIPNWVDISRFKVKKQKNNSKKIVLFAHKLVPRKGADLLPEIINKVTKEVKNAFFLIAGPGDSKFLKIGNKGKILGAVSNKDIPDLMARADLFIMPSRQEGFPRVLIEAMAAGLPFVAMDVGGTRDVVNKLQEKYLVRSGDIDTFSNNIIYLLKNPLKLKTLSLSGLKHAQKYDLKTVSQLFYNLLTS